MNEEKKRPVKPYSVKIEEVGPEIKSRLGCLEKYSHLVNTKMVQAARED